MFLVVFFFFSSVIVIAVLSPVAVSEAVNQLTGDQFARCSAYHRIVDFDHCHHPPNVSAFGGHRCHSMYGRSLLCCCVSTLTRICNPIDYLCREKHVSKLALSQSSISVSFVHVHHHTIAQLWHRSTLRCSGEANPFVGVHHDSVLSPRFSIISSVSQSVSLSFFLWLFSSNFVFWLLSQTFCFPANYVVCT